MATPADPENQLCEFLARYDEALAAGTDAGQFISAPKAGDAESRLVGLQHCIRLLEMDRRFGLLGAGESDTKPLSNPDPSDVASADTCFRRTAVSSPDVSKDPGSAVEQFAETAFAGSTIGRFQILRRLGTGGFGVVFLARDPVLHRFVAVKVPKPEALTVPGFRQRFLRESQVIARLSHPHIVPIHEAGEDGAVTYQVTGFCGGGSLADKLRAARKSAKTPSGTSGSYGWSMPSATAVELLSGLAEAVQYAHDHGILHRDLKPANILLQPFEDIDPKDTATISAAGALEELCRTYRPMVADFGLARIFHSDDEASVRSPEAAIARPESEAVSETVNASDRPESEAGEGTTEFAGTLQYMAPEQIKRQRSLIGPATDVWGLGAVLYEVLTGRPPFSIVEADRRNPTGRTALIVQPRMLNAHIPPDLEAICLKCLDVDVFRRYRNVHGLIGDLRSFSRGEPVIARPWPWHERLMNWTRRKPTVAALMVLSGCLLFGLGLLAIRHYQRLSELNSRLMLTAQELERQVEASDIQRQRAEQQSRQATEQAWLAEHREYAAGMVQANELFQGKDLRRAAEELRRWKDYKGVDDVRGFEWYYLTNLTSRYKVHHGHSATVEAVAFTSDGRFCYSIGRDGEIQHWNTETGEVLSRP